MAEQHQTLAAPAGFSVAFVLLPEFTLSSFSAFMDVLRLAADSNDDSRQHYCHWTLLGKDKHPIKASCGTRIAPDQRFDEQPERFDYVVVCGGLLKGHESIAPEVYGFLQEARAAGSHLVSLCTGSFALAAAGLLDDHKTCVHWVHAADFAARYPQLNVDSSCLYLHGDGITTCSGGFSSADVAIQLILDHGGHQQAHKVMTALGIENLRHGHLPQTHRRAAWFNRIQNQLVRRAILLMASHINKPLSADAIHRALNISASTLERAFKQTLDCSPATFSRLLRLAYGRWELLHSNKAITDIANDFGFSDSSHFSQWYKRIFGYTPSDERAQNQRGAGQYPVSSLGGNVLGQWPQTVQEILAGELLLFDQGMLNQRVEVLP